MSKITIDRDLLEQALEALEHHVEQTRPIYKTTMAIEALIAALDQPQDHFPNAGNRVPTGWKLVPVEPTDDMLYDIQEYSHILPPRGRRIWAHMLAAAPQPPALEQPQPKREPIPNVMMYLGWELHGSNDAYQTWCMAVEWTELCHGIGGKK